MSLSFYADEHIDISLCEQLRKHGVDIVRSVDDGMRSANDEDILERATNLGRIVFTHDDDFTVIGARKQSLFEHFAGVAYCHQYRLSFGQLISELKFLSDNYEPDEAAETVFFLPLRK